LHAVWSRNILDFDGCDDVDDLHAVRGRNILGFDGCNRCVDLSCVSWQF
jgi:hypothetical protein